MIVARIVLGVGALLYPLLVYAGLRTARVRSVALVLGIFLLIRLADSWWRRDRRAALVVMVPIIAAGVVVTLAGLLNEGRLFLFVPVLVNLALLVTFSRTLRGGPSMIEALARLSHATLAPGGEDYCRQVTVVWCGFFVMNMAVITTLAVTGSLAAWALYTGVIAYVLMGFLFTVELTYRSWRFRYYDGAITDVLFRRVFPPRPAG